MISKPNLLITFIRVKGQKNPFKSINFLNENYPIEEYQDILKIEKISEDLFGKDKDKQIIEFILYGENNKDNYIYKFNLYYGANKAYCFLIPYTKYLFELYFKDSKNVQYKDLLLKETDYFDNDSRRRMILINAPILMSIEGSYAYLHEYIPIKIRKEEENSYKVSIFDIQKSYYATNIIKKDDEFSIISLIKIYKKELKDFHDKINNLKSNIEKDYLDIIISYSEKIGIIEFNLSQNKNKLNEEFKNDDDYYLIYLYFLWYILLYSYAKSENNNIRIRTMFDYIKQFYNIYLEDKTLSAYNKVLLFCSNCIYFADIKDINMYKSRKLRYIKTKEIIKNTVYDLAFNFVNKFINKLNSKSLLFYPLLLIDNGLYYFGNDTTNNNDTVYGFDMQTSDNIKNHLRNSLPEVFFEYEEEEKDFIVDNGFNYKGFGTIFLNKARLLKNYDKSPESYVYSNNKEMIESKNFAIKVSKTLMHETFCHNNYIYKSPKSIQSPLKFFTKNNRLVTIVPKNSKVNNNKVFLKASKEYGKGESGKFFEYFFGQYDGNLIIDLIFEINDVSKLYDSIDYYVKENLDDIKKYISMKYLLQKKKIIYEDKKGLSLNQENKELEKLCNINKENVNNLFNEILKSSDSIDDFYFIYEFEGETKGYDYYMKKIKTEKDIFQKAYYLRELMKSLKS